jgi:hypothetical protein
MSTAWLDAPLTLESLTQVYPSLVENAVSNHVNARQTEPRTEAISAEEQERFVSILSFWRKIEFFIPLDLDQQIAEADEHKIRYLYLQDLDRGSSPLVGGSPSGRRSETFSCVSLCVR